jgi:hypothetical protein
MANDGNLLRPEDLTSEQLRERARKGGIASGKARKEKKLMSQIYAEFLQKEHDVSDEDGTLHKISGQSLCNRVMSKVLSRGDSSSVRLLKEIREGTEGQNVKLSVQDVEETKKRLKEIFDIAD